MKKCTTMKHIACWAIMFGTMLATVGCSNDNATNTFMLECNMTQTLSSFSFTQGNVDSKEEADISFYFDGNDCSQGAIFGNDDRKGFIFPVGYKRWDEVSLSETPSPGMESVIGLRPITKSNEGLVFWVKTKSGHFSSQPGR